MAWQAGSVTVRPGSTMTGSTHGRHGLSGYCTARHGSKGFCRRGMAGTDCRDAARYGPVGLSRRGVSGPGWDERVVARSGTAGKEMLVVAGRGFVRQARLGSAQLGVTRPSRNGASCRNATPWGEDWFGRLGELWTGLAGMGIARHGRHIWVCLVWLVSGMERQARSVKVLPVVSRQGWAGGEWFGPDSSGAVSLVQQRLGRRVTVRPGMEGLDQAGME